MRSAKSVEELKKQISQLRQRKSLTNEEIDALNDAAWQLRFISSNLVINVSAETLQFADQNQYQRGRAYALLSAGWCLYLTGQFKKAKQTLIESQDIFAYLEDNVALATAVNALATVKQRMGDYGEAVDDYLFALDLRQKKNDKSGISTVLDNLGVFYHRAGDYVLAVEHYCQALTLAIDSQAQISQTHIYLNLGDLLCRCGQLIESSEYSQKALLMAQEQSSLFNQCVSLVNLGESNFLSNQYNEAQDYYARASTIAQQVNHFEAQSAIYCGVARINLEMNQPEQALMHFAAAHELAQHIGSSFYQSQALLGLGKAHRRMGDFRESREQLERALEISQALKSKEAVSQTHLALSETFEAQGQLAAALFHYQAFHRAWLALHEVGAAYRVSRVMLQRHNLAQTKHLFEEKHLPPVTSADSANRASMWGIGNEWQDKQELTELAVAPKLREVIQFMSVHPEQNVMISELARMAALSPRQFGRVFKHVTGSTPHQFLLAERLKHAERMLQTTRLPLVEVALSCGFSSQSHLTLQLRLATGKTPAQYRRSA